MTQVNINLNKFLISIIYEAVYKAVNLSKSSDNNGPNFKVDTMAVTE